MIRTLIVDDEPNIREGLKLIINWEKLGYTIIGEASNGREALLQIEKHKPDLVITDIKMPELSGLDLIKECKNNNYHITFIILSGHGEFEMAREALHLGASNYLLKPVDEDELEEALKIIKKEKDSGDSKKISKHFFLKAQLQKILFNSTNIDILEIKKNFKLSNEISYYYAFIEFHNIMDRDSSKIEDLINESIPEGVITTLLIEQKSLLGFMIHSGMLKEYRNQINRFTMQLISTAFNKYGYEISIYLGSKKHNILDLRESRRDALIASNHRYYRETGTVIDYELIKNLNFVYDYQEIPVVDNILNGIIDNDSTMVDEAIGKLIEIFKAEYLSAQIIYIHLNKLLNSIIDRVTLLNGFVDPIIDASEFITNREEHVYISELKSKLENLSTTAMDIIKQVKKKSNTALELKEYIDLNYKKNLSLKIVAETFNLNSAYLGQLFKKQTGTTFNTYLHQLRINEAKALLTTTNFKIYKIANEVGYHDVNYFMKKFESTMGITPNTFRKNHQHI